MKTKPNNDINISFANFGKHITPLPIESREYSDDKMVRWGDFNDYPNFLIDLANSSALHGSILQTKSNYIFGDGIIDKKGGEFIGDDFYVNEDDTLSDLIK